MRDWSAKLKQRWTRLWIKPIRVFCFHQVSEAFEPDTMWECDWTQTSRFKKNILTIKEKYTFVSLEEAYRHISKDRIRLKRYAALTADDGWTSVKNIVPWLAEQEIPVTLFLNPLYLDGCHYQERTTEKLLTFGDVLSLVEKYNPFVMIASHGWSHKDCLNMTEDEFGINVKMAEQALESVEGKTPFYAFTYGHCCGSHLDYLRKHSLVPVLIDGSENYSDDSIIHRELLDGNA